MVDDQADIVGETAKHLWLNNVTITFYIPWMSNLGDAYRDLFDFENP